MNIVKLQGIIAGIRKGNITYVTLRVQTSTGEYFPRISFSVKSRREQADLFKRGDVVCIEAKVRPGTARSRTDHQTYYKQNLEGVSIAHLESNSEERELTEDMGIHKLFVSGNSVYMDRAYIAGEILTTKMRNQILSVLICPEGEVNNIWVDCFARTGAKQLAEQLMAGEKVVLLGEVQTKEKIIDEQESSLNEEIETSEDVEITTEAENAGRTRRRRRPLVDKYFENIVVKSMIKIGDAAGISIEDITTEKIDELCGM